MPSPVYGHSPHPPGTMFGYDPVNERYVVVGVSNEGKLATSGVDSPPGFGIYVGTTEPILKTYAQWLSSRTGYWAWVDISSEVSGGVTATIMSANAVGLINPLSSAFARYVTADINPANAIGDITALVAQVTAPGQVSAEVKSANSTGMVSLLTAAYIRYIAAAMNPANSAGAISKLVASYARYMTATVGVAAATGAVNALVATVSGGATAVSDNFNRANNADMGADYTAIPTMSKPGILTNSAYSASGAAGAYRSTETFSANQYSEANVASSGSLYPYIVVRISATEKTFYYAYETTTDLGEGWSGIDTYIMKIVNGGTPSQIAHAYAEGEGLNLSGSSYRLEATGSSTTTLTLKAGTGNGDTRTGSWTQILSGNDTSSPITTGKPGIISPDTTSYVSAAWFGDL